MSAPIRSKPSTKEYRENWDRVFEAAQDSACADCGKTIAPGTGMMLGTNLKPRRVCFRCFADAGKWKP
jgi:hypothetical protein